MEPYARLLGLQSENAGTGYVLFLWHQDLVLLLGLILPHIPLFDNSTFLTLFVNNNLGLEQWSIYKLCRIIFRAFKREKNGFRILLGSMSDRCITIDDIVISMVNRYMTIDGFAFEQLLSRRDGLASLIVVNSKLCDRWSWILTGFFNLFCTKTGKFKINFHYHCDFFDHKPQIYRGLIDSVPRPTFKA